MKIIQVIDAGIGLPHVGNHPGAHAGGTIVLAEDGLIYRLDRKSLTTTDANGNTVYETSWSRLELPALLSEDEKAAAPSK